MAIPSLVDLIAARPVVYDTIQRVAGRDRIMRVLQPLLDAARGRVLDVGGGTGRIQRRLPRSAKYICVDVELEKLTAITGRPNATALLADASALPLADDSVDTALMIGVVHHLPLPLAPAVCREIARVLSPGGRLIMLDAVWAPRRLMGRLLWAADRGSFPRTPEAIETLFSEHFDVLDRNAFAVLHEYRLMTCRKRATL
jgi:ubiquinone/menaquinone biosynthesis C-methylase UbiE